MTAPEWRAPADTMREELPSRGEQQKFPRDTAEDDWSQRDRIVGWASAILGVRVEFVSKGGSHIALCEWSEWAARTLASIITGYRVVRVVPLPKEAARG